MKITLAQALKLKNRLDSKIGYFQSKVSQNSHLVENLTPEMIESSNVNVGKLSRAYELRLILKSKINEANLNLYPKLIQKENYTKLLQFYSNLNCASEVAKHHSGVDIKYVAIISNATKTNEIEFLQSEINNLQDYIDNYNSETQIEVPAEIESILK